MCGICGVVGASDPNTVVAMANAIAHRGPDADGFFTDNSVALGHRRLSIVDLSHGQQPMADRDAVVVFNGEIYNHPQLQEQLSPQRSYQSNSDTETILRAYQKYGIGCVDHLDGMFAFVVYDASRRLLFGARDRFGKKPLYYTSRPFGEVRFAFASELKSLRACPEISSRIRLSQPAIESYLLNDYVTGTNSVWEGISQIAPGAAFVFGLPGSDREGFREWQYWQRTVVASVDGSARENPPAYSEACDQVVQMLTRAVEKRFMSDVPVGVLLSGGIDSSAIVACAQRAGLMPLKTFSIGFDEGSFDETPFAAEVAQRFGTQHYHQNFTSRDLVDRVSRVAASFDEPFADPSVLPTSFLCELAAKHVKTVLGGDGADELLAGYDPFKALGPATWYERLVPRMAHKYAVSPLARLLPDSNKNMSLAFKVSRFLRGVYVPAQDRVRTWMGAFSPGQLTRLMPTARTIHEAFSQSGAKHSPDAIADALDFYQKEYLINDILVKVDRASMMHSLEVRTPFLDTALAEYINRLPSHYKYHRGTTKRLLKDGLLRSRLLSENVVQRRKKGFGIPVARWMRVELHDYFRETLLEDLPSSLGMLDRRVITELWNEHCRGGVNRYKELWALFMLIQWARNTHSAPVCHPQKRSVPALQLHTPSGLRSKSVA